MVCSGQLSPEPRCATKKFGFESSPWTVWGVVAPGSATEPSATKAAAAEGAGTRPVPGRGLPAEPGQGAQPVTPKRAPAAARPRNSRLPNLPEDPPDAFMLSPGPAAGS